MFHSINVIAFLFNGAPASQCAHGVMLSRGRKVYTGGKQAYSYAPEIISCPELLDLIVMDWHGANLSSNDAKRQTALNCTSNTEHHIAKLDNALARISRILDSMKVQHDILIHDRDNLKALLMPIRHIPNELWMNILPAAIQGTDPDFSLFEVCQQWRGLLLSSSQLFDRVQLRKSEHQLREMDEVPHGIHHSFAWGHDGISG
ncbi:hypothetical protein GG344DRAFT_81959 [Lentinula edodes]|nr:hypothetical protein GG344DRAFT_81959 [Lentinula edodes]